MNIEINMEDINESFHLFEPVLAIREGKMVFSHCIFFDPASGGHSFPDLADRLHDFFIADLAHK